MRIVSICLAMLLLCGCSWPKFNWMKSAKTGSITETEQVRTYEVTDTEILVEAEPVLAGPELPDVDYTVAGKTVSVPSNAKVSIHVGSKLKERHSMISEAIGNFKMTTNVGILIIGGAVCLAAGVALCFFGIWTIGMALGVFGIAMITCGVVIEQYPWVFLILMVLGVAVAGVLVYSYIKAKKVSLEKDEQEVTLKALTDEIAKLPAEEYAKIKRALKEMDASATIRKVVSKVKGKTA